MFSSISLHFLVFSDYVSQQSSFTILLVAISAPCGWFYCLQWCPFTYPLLFTHHSMSHFLFFKVILASSVRTRGGHSKVGNCPDPLWWVVSYQLNDFLWLSGQDILPDGQLLHACPQHQLLIFPFTTLSIDNVNFNIRYRQIISNI